MRWFHIVFLIAALAATSGFRFRCIFLCSDQTAIQNDYVEQRDQCRNYAQLKLDTAMQEANEPADEKSRKSMLVTLFSECMAQNGWTVPSGKEESKTAVQAAPVAPTTPASQATVGGQQQLAPAAVTPTPAQNKAAIARAAECDFARQQAGVSGIAASRAKACDYECEGALKANPTGPHPAACPPEATAQNAEAAPAAAPVPAAAQQPAPAQAAKAAPAPAASQQPAPAKAAKTAPSAVAQSATPAQASKTTPVVAAAAAPQPKPTAEKRVVNAAPVAPEPKAAPAPAPLPVAAVSSPAPPPVPAHISTSPTATSAPVAAVAAAPVPATPSFAEAFTRSAKEFSDSWKPALTAFEEKLAPVMNLGLLGALLALMIAFYLLRRVWHREMDKQAHGTTSTPVNISAKIRTRGTSNE